MLDPKQYETKKEIQDKSKSHHLSSMLRTPTSYSNSSIPVKKQYVQNKKLADVTKCTEVENKENGLEVDDKERLNIMQREFEEWLFHIERRLERTCKAPLQVSTPELFQGITKEITSHYAALENIITHSNEILGCQQGIKILDVKHQICRLCERWDRLYERSRDMEKDAWEQLQAWLNYREKLDSFKKYLDEIDGSLTLSKCKSNEELTARIALIKALEAKKRNRTMTRFAKLPLAILNTVFLEELKSKNVIMNELYQEGNRLVNQFEFVVLDDIEKELSDLESYFRSKLDGVVSLINKQELLLIELSDLNEQVDAFRTWFLDCKNVLVEYEQYQYDKGLEGMLDIQTRLKTLLGERESKGPLILNLSQQALHFEIKSNSFLEVQHNFTQINIMKSELPRLEDELTITNEKLAFDIHDWKELDRKLTNMMHYVENKLDENSRSLNTTPSGEIANQLLKLEEKQKELDKQHAEFSDVIKTTERIPLSSSVYFTNKIKTITEKWHELTQFTSERYQLLSLSQHYRKSSQNLSQHLENIETKLDLPLSIKKKVKKENSKAKEMIDTLQAKVENIELFVSAKNENTNDVDNDDNGLIKNLSGLDDEWNSVLDKAQTSCYENEQTTLEWRDLSNLKDRFLNWVDDKEQVVSGSLLKDNFDGVLENVNKYEELQKGINARKNDMDSLLSRAQDLLDKNENKQFIQEVTEKFDKLENLVKERHEHCKHLVEKWKAVQIRKGKLKAMMKSTVWLSGSKKISSIDDVTSFSNECQVIVKELRRLKTDVESEFQNQNNDLPEEFNHLKEELVKKTSRVEQTEETLRSAHCDLSDIEMIKEGITKWCEDRTQSTVGEEDSIERDVVEAEMNSKINLLKDCNTKAKRVLSDCACVLAPGAVSEHLIDMKNNIEEVSRAFDIPFEDIVVVNESNYTNGTSSPKIDTMQLVWEDNNDTPSSIMEILIKNQVPDKMNITSELEKLSKLTETTKDSTIDDILTNSKKVLCNGSEVLTSLPSIKVTEHTDEHNFFVHDYLSNMNKNENFADVVREVGVLIGYCLEAYETSIFKIEQKFEDVVPIDDQLSDTIFQELETFDLLKDSPNNTENSTYELKSLILDHDFDISVFQNLLGSFQKNMVAFAKHLKLTRNLTKKCKTNNTKKKKNAKGLKDDYNKEDDVILLSSSNSPQKILPSQNDNYPSELLDSVKNIKKCLLGLTEKLICLLDMSTKLHIYQYTSDEVELLQKNLSYLYNAFKSVHDHLNSKLDVIAEIKDEYIAIEKSILNEEIWLNDVINIFSIEVMSITDENEIFEFMEKKSRYQHELTERSEKTLDLLKRVEELFCFENILTSKLTKLKDGQDELLKLSDSQDQRFENDMEKEDKFYEKVEEFITWIGVANGGRDDNCDIAKIFANHNALVKEIECKANDLTFLNSLGTELLDLATTEERRLSFTNQLEEIRLEWNRLLEKMSEKEILLANIYKVRPRNFAKMLVAKSQLEVEGKSASPPIGIILANLNNEEEIEEEEILSVSISQQNATVGDSDDGRTDSLMEQPSEVSIPMDSFDNSPSFEVNTRESLESNEDLNNTGSSLKSEIILPDDTKKIIACSSPIKQFIMSGIDSLVEQCIPNNGVLTPSGRCASSLKDFSQEIIQTSQKNVEEYFSSSESGSLENINIKLKIDIENEVDEEERDLEVEAIVFYVEDILVQIGKILNQSDPNFESMEKTVFAITTNINTLLQLSSDLQQSLLKLEKIENVLYAALIGNLIKRVTGILEFLEPYIEALTGDLEKFTYLVELYQQCSHSVSDYNNNIESLEKLVISELESANSFIVFRAVLDTAMTKMKGQAEMLSDVITSIKKNVNMLPSEEKSILKEGIDNAILKTNELEKLVIDSKLDVDLLVSEFANVEEKLKPIKRWVNRTKNTIRASNLDMREKINEKCVEFTASLYDLFKYSSSFMDRLPKTDQNNLKMRFEMLFKSLKDIKTLLDSTPAGENSYGQTNTKSMFLSMLTICTANTRFLLDNASDAAIENENEINIDQFLIEMKFLEESTSEITNEFGEYLHCFRRSELKSTSCDLINMLDQQVQIKTLLYDVDVQQGEKALNALFVDKLQNSADSLTDESAHISVTNTFQNAKLMIFLLYKHQLVVSDLNKEICVLPNLLVDAFTRKDFYINTIQNYERLFKQICTRHDQLSGRLSDIENSEFKKVIDSVNNEYSKLKESFNVYLEFLNFAQEVKLEVEIMIDVATRTIQEVKQQLFHIRNVSNVNIKCELLTPILITLKNLIRQGKNIRNINLQMLPKIDKEQIDYILWELRIKVNRLFDAVSKTRRQCELFKLQKILSLNVVPYLYSEQHRYQQYFYPLFLSQVNVDRTFITHTYACEIPKMNPLTVVHSLLESLVLLPINGSVIYPFMNDNRKLITHNQSNTISTDSDSNVQCLRKDLFKVHKENTRNLSSKLTNRRLQNSYQPFEVSSTSCSCPDTNRKNKLFLRKRGEVSAGQNYSTDYPIIRTLQQSSNKNQFKYTLDTLGVNLLKPHFCTKKGIVVTQQYPFSKHTIFSNKNKRQKTIMDDSLNKFIQKCFLNDSFNKIENCLLLPTRFKPNLFNVDHLLNSSVSNPHQAYKQSANGFHTHSPDFIFDIYKTIMKTEFILHNTKSNDVVFFDFDQQVTDNAFVAMMENVDSGLSTKTGLGSHVRLWDNRNQLFTFDNHFDDCHQFFKTIFNKEKTLILNSASDLDFNVEELSGIEKIHNIEESKYEKTQDDFDRIYNLDSTLLLTDIPQISDISLNQVLHFDDLIQEMDNIVSRDDMVEVSESRIKPACSPTQLESMSHARTDIFNVISPQTVSREEIGTNLGPDIGMSTPNKSGELTVDVSAERSIDEADGAIPARKISPYHRLCVSPELSEDTISFEWDDNDIAAELPFSSIEDDYFTIDDLKCERDTTLSQHDTSNDTISSDTSTLKSGSDVQTAVISILEAAVLQLNEYEKLEVGYQDFASIDEALMITDNLNFHEAQSELIKCEVLILSLKDQIPDSELDELLEETAVLQKYFTDTCEDLVKWKRKLSNVKTLQYEYEIALHSLLCKLTAFRERIIENAKISLNSISKQLNIDKQMLLKLKEEVNSIKQNRLNIEKRLPCPVREELKLMENEFIEELNAMFCNVYKEEAYAKELMTNKLNLSQSISKVSYTLRVFQEHFNEVIQSEKTDSFEDLKKMMQELVKINDNWEHDKNEIKKLIIMLPHEDIKNIETTNTNIATIFKYIQEQLKNNPMLINYFLDIDKRLAVWAQKFSSLESMQKYDQTMVLQEQLKVNNMLMDLVSEYSTDLMDIFKDIEITFSLNIIGYSNNDKQEKMKVCASTYQNKIKEIEICIREKINQITQAQCNLEKWFTQQKDLERKINFLLEASRHDTKKEILLEEMFNEYTTLTNRFDEVKMFLPMGDLIVVQQSLSFLRNKINQLKDRETSKSEIEDDHSSLCTTPVSEDYSSLDVEELEFTNFGSYTDALVRAESSSPEEKIALDFVIIKKNSNLKNFNQYFEDTRILPTSESFSFHVHCGPKKIDCFENLSCLLNLPLSSRRHRILSAHSFNIRQLKRTFQLSFLSARKIYTKIFSRTKKGLSLPSFASNLYYVPFDSIKDFNRIFITNSTDIDEIQEIMQFHLNMNRRLLMIPFSYFIPNPIFDKSIEKFVMSQQMCVLDVNAQNGLSFSNTQSVNQESCYTDLLGGYKEDHCVSDRVGLIDKEGNDGFLENPCFDQSEDVGDNDDEDDENTTLTEHDSTDSIPTPTATNTTSLDMRIKNLQSECLDDSVRKLCEEVRLLSEEDLTEICDPELNVIQNKLNIIKDLISCSQSDKSYLQETVDAAELTLFHLAMQISQKSNTSLEHLDDEAITPPPPILTDTKTLQEDDITLQQAPVIYKKEQSIHSISLDPICELEEEFHDANDTFTLPDSTAPLINEKEIIPVAIQAQYEEVQNFDMLEENEVHDEENAFDSVSEDTITESISEDVNGVIKEDDIVPVTLDSNSEYFSEDVFSNLELIQNDNKVVLDQELIDAILMDNPMIHNGSTDMVPQDMVEEDTIVPEVHAHDSSSYADPDFGIYQPSQLFQQAFPGYFTDMVVTESVDEEGEKFTFKSVTSIYELNDSEENYDAIMNMEHSAFNCDGLVLEEVEQEIERCEMMDAQQQEQQQQANTVKTITEEIGMIQKENLYNKQFTIIEEDEEEEEEEEYKDTVEVMDEVEGKVIQNNVEEAESNETEPEVELQEVEKMDVTTEKQERLNKGDQTNKSCQTSDEKKEESIAEKEDVVTERIPVSNEEDKSLKPELYNSTDSGVVVDKLEKTGSNGELNNIGEDDSSHVEPPSLPTDSETSSENLSTETVVQNLNATKEVEEIDLGGVYELFEYENADDNAEAEFITVDQQPAINDLKPKVSSIDPTDDEDCTTTDQSFSQSAEIVNVKACRDIVSGVVADEFSESTCDNMTTNNENESDNSENDSTSELSSDNEAYLGRPLLPEELDADFTDPVITTDIEGESIAEKGELESNEKDCKPVRKPLELDEMYLDNGDDDSSSDDNSTIKDPDEDYSSTSERVAELLGHCDSLEEFSSCDTEELIGQLHLATDDRLNYLGAIKDDDIIKSLDRIFTGPNNGGYVTKQHHEKEKERGRKNLDDTLDDISTPRDDMSGAVLNDTLDDISSHRDEVAVPISLLNGNRKIPTLTVDSLDTSCKENEDTAQENGNRLHPSQDDSLDDISSCDEDQLIDQLQLHVDNKPLVYLKAAYEDDVDAFRYIKTFGCNVTRDKNPSSELSPSRAVAGSSSSEYTSSSADEGLESPRSPTTYGGEPYSNRSTPELVHLPLIETVETLKMHENVENDEPSEKSEAASWKSMRPTEEVVEAACEEVVIGSSENSPRNIFYNGGEDIAWDDEGISLSEEESRYYITDNIIEKPPLVPEILTEIIQTNNEIDNDLAEAICENKNSFVEQVSSEDSEDDFSDVYHGYARLLHESDSSFDTDEFNNSKETVDSNDPSTDWSMEHNEHDFNPDSPMPPVQVVIPGQEKGERDQHSPEGILLLSDFEIKKSSQERNKDFLSDQQSSDARIATSETVAEDPAAFEENGTGDDSDLSSSGEQNEFEGIVVQMDKIIKSLSQSFDYRPPDGIKGGMEGILEQDDREFSVADTISTADEAYSELEQYEELREKLMKVEDLPDVEELPHDEELIDQSNTSRDHDGRFMTSLDENEIEEEYEFEPSQVDYYQEEPDVLPFADFPSELPEDNILPSVGNNDIDHIISHPHHPQEDIEAPSLFSELSVVEDEQLKNFAFQEMAEKLHASISDTQTRVILNSQTPDNSMCDSNGDIIYNASTPLCIENGGVSPMFNHQNFPGSADNMSPINGYCDHGETMWVNPDESSERNFSNSNHSFETDFFPNVSNESGSHVSHSPLYGKEREMCKSRAHAQQESSIAEEEDMGLDAFCCKIQRCMVSMVELSNKLNQMRTCGVNGEINEEMELQQKLEILAIIGSQQSQIDSLNICESENESEFTQKVQEKIDIMNENWTAIQEKAYKIVYLDETKGSEATDVRCPEKNLSEEDKMEYQCLLSELSERLPGYEEELRVPLSLYSTSEIQWKISRLQDACQYIKSKQLPLEYLHTHYTSQLTNHVQPRELYNDSMETGNYIYEELITKLQSLSLICFKMLSFESLKIYLLSWLDRLEETSIKPLLEREENDFDCIEQKLVKLTEIEKRLSDKYNTKERLLNNANALIASVDNSELKMDVRSITIRWENICLLLKELRGHLENIINIWTQFTNLAEGLEQWLSSNLNSVTASLEHSSIDSVKLEIELIRNLQNELDQKQNDKDVLKDLRSSLSNCVNGKVLHIVGQRMADIENMWLELKCSLQERVEHLALLIDEVEMVNINEMVQNATACINECDEQLKVYDETPATTFFEIEEEIKILQQLSTNLSNQRPSLDFLIQLSADYKWNDRTKFQTDTMLLQESYDVIVGEIEQKIKHLKTLLSKLNMLEDMIEDIVGQLSTVDGDLHTSNEAIHEGDLDTARDCLKVSSKTLSSLAQTVEYVNSTSKSIAKDYKHPQLEIIEQAEKLLGHYQSANQKLADVNMKLSGFSSYESISNEIELLQNYVSQANEMADSVQRVDISEEKLVQVRKQISNYSKELPLYEERSSNLYNSLLHLVTDNHVHHMLATWLQVSKQLVKTLAELKTTFEKKDQQIDVMMTSLTQYVEDYNELSDWLGEKEQQYETLLDQANSPTCKLKLALGNKCKKLRDDMSVFVTFSESMQSLFYNKNRFCSCHFVTSKQEELNSRYEVLKMQVVTLYERVIKSNEKSAMCEELIKNIYKWLDRVEKIEVKSSMSLDSAAQVLETSITDASHFQTQLDDVLKNPDDVTEKDRRGELEALMDRLEVLATDLQYNSKQIEKLQKDVGSFDVRCNETMNIINSLKQDFKRRTHSLSFESFKTQKSLVIAKMDQLKSFSQNILNHACVTNDLMVKVDNQLLKVSDLWTQTLKECSKYEDLDSSDVETWKEFDSILKTLMEWVTTMKEKIYGMEYKLSGSSIEMLKNSYSGILALRDEFVDQRVLYDKLIKVSNKLIESNDVVAENVRKSVLNTEITWTELELVVMKQLDDTKNILQQWTSYTQEMKSLMKWLRAFEKEIKPTHHRLSWKDLELMCQKFQSMSKQFETKEGSYETIKMHMNALSRVAIMDDQIVLQHQMSTLSQLWQSLKRQLKEKMKTLKKLLAWVESFSHNNKVFETWLNGVEQTLSSNEFKSDPEKQKQRIKLIYSEDIAKYDVTFSELRNTAVQILTYGSTCTFANDIQDKFICINKRWKQLCQKLSINHRNVEETVFMLNLLDEMLKQLTTWLTRVMERLKEVDLDSCSIEYMEEALADVQDLIVEFNNQDQDFQSIKEIYVNIQESHNANVYVDDLERLLKHSENFKTKWTETRNKIHMYKSYLLNRVAIFNEWMKEVSQMSDWIDALGLKFDSNGIYSDNHRILEDFTIANKSLERIKKTCSHLTTGSNCVASKKISQTTRSIESKFEEITSDYNYISKKHMKNNKRLLSNNYQQSLLDDDLIKMELQTEKWLTEVEIKLISLRPFTSVEDEETQLAQLRELNAEIREKGSSIERLKSRMSNNKSAMKMITLNGSMSELQERYDLALKESAMWIENLKRPRLLTD